MNKTIVTANYYKQKSNITVDVVRNNPVDVTPYIVKASKNLYDYGLPLTGVRANKAPCHGKGWQSKAHTPSEIEFAVGIGDCKGLGLLTGLVFKGNAFLILDLDGLSTFDVLKEKDLKHTLAVVSGSYDRVKLIYRVPEKDVGLYKANKFSTGTDKEQIEVLYKGNQGVIFGEHKLGRYKFIEGHSITDFKSVQDIPEPPEFLRSELVVSFGGKPVQPTLPKFTPYVEPIKKDDIGKLIKALEYLDCNDTQHWVTVTKACAYLTQQFEDHDRHDEAQQVIDIWDNWSSPGSSYDEQENFSRFNSFKQYNGRPIRLGTVLRLATENGLKPTKEPKQHSKYTHTAKQQLPTRKGKNMFRPLSECFNEIGVVQDSIVHGMLVQGESAIFAALPGTGKTTLSLDVAASVLEGKDFLGHKTKKGKVLILCPNRPADTIAKMEERGLTPENYENELSVVSDFSFESIPDLKETLDKGDISLVILDSLTDYFGKCEVDENRANDVHHVLDPLVKAFQKTNAGLLIIHHTKKQGKDGYSYNASDFRGSVAITGIVHAQWGLYGKPGSKEFLFRTGGHVQTSEYIVGHNESDLIYDEGYWKMIRETNDGNEADLIEITHTGTTVERIQELLSKTNSKFTNQELSDKLGVSLNTVKKSTERLFKKGQIKREKLKADNGRRPWAFYIGEETTDEHQVERKHTDSNPTDSHSTGTLTKEVTHYKPTNDEQHTVNSDYRKTDYVTNAQYTYYQEFLKYSQNKPSDEEILSRGVPEGYVSKEEAIEDTLDFILNGANA